MRMHNLINRPDDAYYWDDLNAVIQQRPTCEKIRISDIDGALHYVANGKHYWAFFEGSRDVKDAESGQSWLYSALVICLLASPVVGDARIFSFQGEPPELPLSFITEFKEWWEKLPERGRSGLR
jgi:hypothetical protein